MPGVWGEEPLRRNERSDVPNKRIRIKEKTGADERSDVRGSVVRQIAADKRSDVRGSVVRRIAATFSERSAPSRIARQIHSTLQSKSRSRPCSPPLLSTKSASSGALFFIKQSRGRKSSASHSTFHRPGRIKAETSISNERDDWLRGTLCSRPDDLRGAGTEPEWADRTHRR